MDAAFVSEVEEAAGGVAGGPLGFTDTIVRPCLCISCMVRLSRFNGTRRVSGLCNLLEPPAAVVTCSDCSSEGPIPFRSEGASSLL